MTTSGDSCVNQCNPKIRRLYVAKLVLTILGGREGITERFRVLGVERV